MPSAPLQQFPIWAKVLVTTLLIALTALSWSRYADEAANTATADHFKRALAIAAVARGLNGVISVAQGTEVAIQPVGVGVTLTLGEVLDPFNDLVERFSALALVASVSLGLQLTLGQILATTWFSLSLTVVVVVFVCLLWRTPAPSPLAPTQPNRRGANRLMNFCAKLLGTLVFLRFFLAITLLVTHLVDQTFLAPAQEVAVKNLSFAADAIDTLQQRQTETGGAEEADFFDRSVTQLSQLLDSSKQTLDLKAQLEALEVQVENSVEEMINLIVIFILQTLLVPIFSIWLCWRGLKFYWTSSGPGLVQAQAEPKSP